MDVISCKRLTRHFGSVAAVSGLDLGVSAGQVYGFLGPNGAGKTTTIRMLVGLIAPTEGQIRLLGRLLPDPRAVAGTGSMIEEPAFYPWLAGRQNLQVMAGGGCAAAEFGRVLGVTGLREVAGRKVRTYSQGMRQRLGLADGTTVFMSSRGSATFPASCDGPGTRACAPSCAWTASPGHWPLESSSRATGSCRRA